MTKKIFIAGSGGIGEAAALLVREWAEFETEIFLGDISEDNLQKAKDFVAAKFAENFKNRNCFDVDRRRERSDEISF